jgi:hypothetical protein
MRHRQNSGAGPSGVRPSIFVFVLLSASTIPAIVLRDPMGPWIAYASTAVGAAIGVGALWTQRGLVERRVEAMAGRRRADLATAGETEQRHLDELERVRAELEEERQYTAVIREQLNRLRTVAEEERQLRITAERQVDSVTRTLAGEVLPVDDAALPHPVPAAQEALESEAADDLLYRPFIEMAPVLDLSGESDREGVLDLTAYDQTVEFSVQTLRRKIA